MDYWNKNRVSNIWQETQRIKKTVSSKLSVCKFIYFLWPGKDFAKSWSASQKREGLANMKFTSLRNQKHVMSIIRIRKVSETLALYPKNGWATPSRLLVIQRTGTSDPSKTFNHKNLHVLPRGMFPGSTQHNVPVVMSNYPLVRRRMSDTPPQGRNFNVKWQPLKFSYQMFSGVQVIQHI